MIQMTSERFTGEEVDLSLLVGLESMPSPDDQAGSDPLLQPWREEVVHSLERVSALVSWPIGRIRDELSWGEEASSTQDVLVLQECVSYLQYLENMVTLSESEADRRASLLFLIEMYENAGRRFARLVPDIGKRYHDNDLAASDYLHMGDPYAARQSVQSRLDPHLSRTTIESFVLQPDQLHVVARATLEAHVRSCDDCSTVSAQVRETMPRLKSVEND